MQFIKSAFPLIAAFFLILVCCAGAHGEAASGPVALTVVDENNIVISGAEVVIWEPGKPSVRMTTDYSGRVPSFRGERRPTCSVCRRPDFTRSSLMKTILPFAVSGLFIIMNKCWCSRSTSRRCPDHALRSPRLPSRQGTAHPASAVDRQLRYRQPRPLAWSDAGYLAEAYKQWMGKDEPNPASG